MVDAGAGNDDITSGLSTHVDAGTGNDTTSVDTTGAAEGTFRDPAATLEAGDGDDVVTAIGAGIGIRTGAGAGAGDDAITASGSRMDIDGGTGADTINIAGLSDSTVYLTGEDVLEGYADSRDIDMHLSGVEQFQGTAGNDTISYATGSVSLAGGTGDDRLSFTATNPTETGRASTLDGGAGDDTLIGGTYEQVTTSGSHGEIRWGQGDSDDLLLGGDGNDTICFDRADTVTGGAGRDSLVYLADANSSASVTDFTAGEDVMTIYLNPEDVCLTHATLDNPGEIPASENDGKTTIGLSGSEIISLDGTGLNIGFCHTNPDIDGPDTWTDLNGNVVDPATLDVRIDAYEGENF